MFAVGPQYGGCNCSWLPSLHLFGYCSTDSATAKSVCWQLHDAALLQQSCCWWNHSTQLRTCVLGSIQHHKLVHMLMYAAAGPVRVVRYLSLAAVQCSCWQLHDAALLHCCSRPTQHALARPVRTRKLSYCQERLPAAA